MSAASPPSTDASDWAPFGPSPDRGIERLMQAVAPGPVLYAGALSAERAQRFREAGFDLDLAALPEVVRPPSADPEARHAIGRTVDVTAASSLDARYALVVLDRVLPLLEPKDGDRLLTMARGATRPGGIVYVSGLTIADPAYEALGATAAETARHAVRLDDGRWVRFLVPGELAMAFEGWIVLLSQDRVEEDERGRTRRTTVLAARRPSGSSLLA